MLYYYITLFYVQQNLINLKIEVSPSYIGGNEKIPGKHIQMYMKKVGKYIT